MRVLRAAAAICGFVMLALPSPVSALAALDAGTVQSGPTTRMLAVEAALGQAESSGDPIEELVLEGVRSFYASRDFDLAWLTERQSTPQVLALRARMDDASSYGLDPAAYVTPTLAAMFLEDPATLAAADIEFSRAVARLIMHIGSGRIRPRDISSIIALDPERPDVALALDALSDASDVDETLASFEPPHPQYVALKGALSELLAQDDDASQVVIPEGELLRPGQHDSRVPLLRLRLGIVLEVRAEPGLYDAGLAAAVEAFQGASGLTVDGIIGPRTLFAMNGVSREDQLASIAANLERWRWMPRDLGRFHVMVNIPEFVVRVVDDNATVHQTRVVVGSQRHRTPIFSHVMDHLVVNPYWNVPTSIVINEMLPEIRQNPGAYFSRHGYQVLNNAGSVIDPWSVDWYSGTPRGIHIRQVPGDGNALGRIKFMFPNQHSVYLHDTPSKSLFERDFRAYSHGCVRVDNPLAFADAILPTSAPEWSSQRLEALYGGRERRINLDTPIPVHLAYFTLWVSEDGELNRFEDVYGYDGEIRALYGV